MIFEQLMLVIANILLIVVWLGTRNNRKFLPSDSFFLSYLLLYGLAPLVNVSGSNALLDSALFFQSSSIAKTLFGLVVTSLSLGTAWFVSRFFFNIDAHITLKPNRNDIRLEFGILANYFKISMYMLLVLLVALFVFGSFLDYKLSILKFLTGQMDHTEYIFSRRYKYNSDVSVSTLVAKFRYSLFALLIVISSLYVMLKYGGYKGVIFFLCLFLIYSSAFQKLPYVFYFLYLIVLFAIVRWPKLLNFYTTLKYSLIMVFVLLFLLTGLYYVQYPQFIGTKSVAEVFSFAVYRVFSINYSLLIAYFEIYPNVQSYTSFNSIGIVSKFTGIVRNPDAEVARVIYGTYTRTSNPTGFMGNAYASFGLLGIVVYSFFAMFILRYVDYFVIKIANGYMKTACYTLLIVNVTFLNQVAFTPSLLTYGILFIPLAALAFNAVLRN